MTSIDTSPELFDEFTLPSATGGRKRAKDVGIAVTRELTRSDLEALVDGAAPLEPQVHSSILKLRHSHHQLARHIAAGTPMIEVAEITGYSLPYISILKADPAFCDLLAHYERERKEIFIDTVERAKTLSIVALEELQDRLLTEPESFKHRELMEVAELGLQAGGGKSAGGGGASSGTPLIQISFVAPSESQISASGPILDLSPEEEQ